MHVERPQSETPYQQDAYVRIMAFFGRMLLAALPLLVLGAVVGFRWWFWPLGIALAAVGAIFMRPNEGAPADQSRIGGEAEDRTERWSARIGGAARKPMRWPIRLFRSCLLAVVILLATPFLALGLVTGSCQGLFYSDLPFDAAAWEEAEPWKDGPESPRWRMRKAVMEAIEPGMSKESVEAILGTSENDWYGSSLMYHLGNRGQCFGHSDGPWLVVFLRADRVSSVEIQCTD